MSFWGEPLSYDIQKLTYEKKVTQDRMLYKRALAVLTVFKSLWPLILNLYFGWAYENYYFYIFFNFLKFNYSESDIQQPILIVTTKENTPISETSTSLSTFRGVPPKRGVQKKLDKQWQQQQPFPPPPSFSARSFQHYNLMEFNNNNNETSSFLSSNKANNSLFQIATGIR